MAQTLKKDSGETAFVVLEPEEYARLRAAAEDNEDAHAAREALVDPGVLLPHDFMRRLLAGENPVKVWREFRGLTQTQLAERAGFGQSDISRIEGGHNVRFSTMGAIAAALDISLDELVQT
jgi:DNA-binding Xre family transcriptional regulator